VSTTKNNTAVSGKEITTETIREYFDGLIKQFEDDKHAMLYGIIPDDKAKLYEKLILGDYEPIVENVVNASIKKNLYDMFQDYLATFNTHKIETTKLAFSLRRTSIYVYVEVNDEDTDSSRNLMLSESSIIEKYYPKGFRMNTMIVEKSDNVNVPEGYNEFPLSTSVKF
jgi:hypothetical protein